MRRDKNLTPSRYTQAGLLHLDAPGLIYHYIAHPVAELSFRRPSQQLMKTSLCYKLLVYLMGGSIFDLVSVSTAKCQTLELDQAGLHHLVASGLIHIF